MVAVITVSVLATPWEQCDTISTIHVLTACKCTIT